MSSTMRENGMPFRILLGCESREESDRTIAKVYAGKRMDKTVGYMQALNKELNNC